MPQLRGLPWFGRVRGVEQQVRRGGQAGEAAISRMGRDRRCVYSGN